MKMALSITIGIYSKETKDVSNASSLALRGSKPIAVLTVTKTPEALWCQ